MLADKTPKKLCDLCSGTGDIVRRLSLAMPKRALPEIHCVDFSPVMVEVAKVHAPDAVFHVADVLALPFEDASFDTMTCAWGIRNVSDHEQCLKEAARTIIPGGRLYILELTRPHSKFLHMLHSFYLKHIVPPLGRVIAHNQDAYCWLQESIDSFVSPETLILAAKLAGWKTISARPLVYGVATLFTLER